MKLFNVFGASSSSSFSLSEKWQELSSLEQWKEVLKKSKETKVVVFKHSTRCHISKRVLANFQEELESSSSSAEFYYLDLIAHREVSNQIASDLKVIHQSPQLLVVEDGNCTENASHSAISLSLV